MKTSLKWEGNSHPSPRNPESPKQDKPKAKHPKTHINQINEGQTQRTNIKSNKGKTTNNTQRDSNKDNSLRESVPRQIDKKSRGPQEERGLEFSRRKKGQTFLSLYIP